MSRYQRWMPKIRVSLRTEIRAIQKKMGITAIYVTHDQEEALSISDRVVVMNNGRIEQAGKPLEIYNAPETAFVAQFVGTLSAIPAVVLDVQAGRLGVEDQELVTSSSLEGYSKGDPITIALRPEQLSIKSGDDDGNSLRCTIENITFLGSIVRFSLRLGGKTIEMDSFNNPHYDHTQDWREHHDQLRPRFNSGAAFDKAGNHRSSRA